ncbi:hypothetical protein SDC9_142758 [bioreactor metagenome]|uniref:Uncharacterized protein n=1 Tax=bioreactor metagenome TaxID=1076179 RepID=A0A645E472_9ZZZZ
MLGKNRREMLKEIKKQHHGKTAYNGAPQSIATGFPGALQIGVHSEHGTHTGKGRVAVNKGVNKCAQGAGNGCFKIAHADFGDSKRFVLLG